MANQVCRLFSLGRSIKHLSSRPLSQFSVIANNRIQHNNQLCRPPTHILQTHREFNAPNKSKSFFGKILDNMKEESAKNQKLKESFENFKKDLEEMNTSSTTRAAREKFHKIEEETAEGTRKAKQQLNKFKEKVSKSVEDAQNNEMIQKASKITGEAKEKVQQVGQNISQKSEELAKTQAFQKVSETVTAVKDEINASALSSAGMKVYKPPTVLRMRSDVIPMSERPVIKVNEDATGMVLHKDSRFSQTWQNFKDNNQYVHKVLAWKTRMDESDNAVVRASMMLKDKVVDICGSMFTTNEISGCLTEICKVDPDFNINDFTKELEFDIIPNILEAMYRPDMEVLKDWSSERAASIVAAEYQALATLGHTRRSKILDLDSVEITYGKVMDEGPLLVANFSSQLTSYIEDSKGEIIEGKKDQVLRAQNIFVMFRDQTELDPRKAWRLLEFQVQVSEQML